MTSAGNQTWDDLDDVGRDVEDGVGDNDDDSNVDDDNAENCIMMTETKI